MSEIEKKWYVLRAVSGKESKVKEYLDADIKNSDLSEYVSQVLIPTDLSTDKERQSQAREAYENSKFELTKSLMILEVISRTPIIRK